MAEALLRAELLHRNNRVTVSSAGFIGSGNLPDKKAVQALDRLGLDLGEHRSTPIKKALSQSPELILVMAREHLRSLEVIAPGAMNKAFTLKEFVRLIEIEGRRRNDEPLQAYIQRVGVGRSVSAITSPSVGDDISDPLGHRRGMFLRCAEELSPLVRSVAAHLYPVLLGSSADP